MKLLNFNRKEGIAKLIPDSLDDLYHLSKLVEEGDLASAMSSRKLKKGGEQGRQSATRRPCFIRVKVKKTELDYASAVLKIAGEVDNEPQDVPKGSAHSLTIEAGLQLKLQKESWKKHQIDRLSKAQEKRYASTLLICSLDDDGAAFASISSAGIRELGEIELSLASKRAKVSAKAQYETLVAALGNFHKQYPSSKIVLASPGFWKDELFKVLKSKDAELAKKVRVERVSTGGLAGVKELVKKGASKESTLEEEAKLVEELSRRIANAPFGKSGGGKNATYGLTETRKAVAAIEKLAISERFIAKSRRAGNYGGVEKLVDAVEAAHGRVLVFDSKSEAGKVLDGLGGVAALLRYRV